VLIGAGMALAAGQGMLSAPDGASIVAFLTMAALAAATIRVGLDLCAVADSGGDKPRRQP
jgi:hypothetical protein